MAAQKWQRQRQKQLARRERVKNLREEIERLHGELTSRTDPTEYKAVAKLKARLRTLEQQLRYISDFPV
jgi:hypothetical protein